MSTNCCLNCRFSLPVAGSTTMRECHKNAPRPNHESVSVKWPNVANNNHCGEWKQVKPQ